MHSQSKPGHCWQARSLGRTRCLSMLIHPWHVAGDLDLLQEEK